MRRAQTRKNKRKHGNSTWKPRVHDKVLVRLQPSLDIIAGVTGKFIRPFEGPYMIDTVIPLSTIKGCDSNVKIKRSINWKSIKVYKEASDKI
jgi:hypothetical protein